MKKIIVQKAGLLNYEDGIAMIVELIALAERQGFSKEGVSEIFRGLKGDASDKSNALIQIIDKLELI